MNTFKRCILLFAKVPVKGKVKTRLSRSLDVEFVFNLYQCFILDQIESLKQGCEHVIVFYHPHDKHDVMNNLLKNEFRLIPQSGVDLGERMHNAFKAAFHFGFNQVLLVGSDIPDLSPSYLKTAFQKLCRHDAVIGPALDGGYFLIGFNSATFLPEVFYKIAWGTATVFQSTAEFFNKHHSDIHILPEMRDIDTFQDLADFYIEAETKKMTNVSRTYQFLKKNHFKRFFEIP